MTKMEELKRRHAEEIVRAEREEAICALLPVEPVSIYAHKDYASVTYKQALTYPATWTLADALTVYRAFVPNIVDSEHWRAGCLSCKPEPLNDYAKNERAQMDGADWSEVLLEGCESYRNASLRFWAKIGEYWLHVSCEFLMPAGWTPRRHEERDGRGRIVARRIVPAFIGEDQQIKWHSDYPSYRISYFWADRVNFESWASNQEVTP